MQDTPLLNRIGSLEDYKQLPQKDLEELAREIRLCLVNVVSQNGGHLASNLGAVELTMALDRVFDSPKDKLIFDVGHQAYVHKLLTGRYADFPTLRKAHGLAGFPKREESVHDAFNTGHASTSISAALGMLRAMQLRGDTVHCAVALIGDGALGGGMAFEALNDGGQSGLPLIVLLNDNGMSIAKNVGAMAMHLCKVRTSKRYNDLKRRVIDRVEKIPRIGPGLYGRISRFKERIKYFLLPNVLFEEMGYTYLGPIDGHDLTALIRVLEKAKALRQPVVIHTVTQKGKGYSLAESSPDKFHGIGAFDPETGYIRGKTACTNSDVFGMTLCDLAKQDKRIVAITAAMPDGTGLTDFARRYPARFFDVGIAEQHAVTLAAGMAATGLRPVVAIYSTFLQRAYDQIMQDIAMLHLHVILAVDRAGLVGDDGPTHHGVFDVGFLRQVPGMLILAPASLAEQKDMLSWAAETYNGPVAVRYPRGGEGSYRDSAWQPGENVETEGLLCCHRHGGDVTLVTYGSMLDNVLEAAEILSQRGIEATILRLLTVSALPTREILTEMSEKRRVIVAEEVCTGSGIREALAWELRKLCPDCRVDGVDLGADFVTHGSTKELYRHYGLDGESIANYTQGVLS